MRQVLEWIRDNKGKFIALLIACFYLIMAVLICKEYTWLRLLAFLLFPLSCIFFSEAMGDYTGGTLTKPPITNPSPGWLVAILGWVLLLLPFFIFLIIYLRK